MREANREDDDEHDDDTVGGCQGVLEYRRRSVTCEERERERGRERRRVRVYVREAEPT